MTMMRCPLGHPPGPQQFCPICGRAMVPVPDEPTPVAPLVPPTQNAPTQALLMPLNLQPVEPLPPEPQVEPLPPAPLPSAPLPPSQAAADPAGEPPPAGESAAAQAQRLIDELRAGRTEDPPAAAATPAPVSSWGPRPDVASAPTQDRGSGVLDTHSDSGD